MNISTLMALPLLWQGENLKPEIDCLSGQANFWKISSTLVTKISFCGNVETWAPGQKKNLSHSSTKLLAIMTRTSIHFEMAKNAWFFTQSLIHTSFYGHCQLAHSKHATTQVVLQKIPFGPRHPSQDGGWIIFLKECLEMEVLRDGHPNLSK